MIISHKYKFIFIKTHKTAGSSIEMFLDKYLDDNDISTGSDVDEVAPRNINVDGHVSWNYIQKLYPYEWQNYFKIAVERNPWDAMVSRYYWYKKVKPKKAKNSFTEFIMNRVKLQSMNDWSMYAKEDTIVVDHLVKYENLHKFFRKQDIIPYKNEMLSTFVKSGIRPKPSYKEMYNPVTRKLVAEEFSKQINLLGYRF